MTRSASDLMRSGMVSTKAYNSTLAKTRSGVPTKMARFEASDRDEGKPRRGVKSSRAINQNQRETAAGVKAPTSRKGGKQRRGQPKVGHINREQGPRFSRSAGYGANPKGYSATSNPARTTGGPRGNTTDYYGGPNSNPAEGG